MADGILGVDEAATIDKNIDVETLTVGSNTVMRERVQIAGSSALQIAPVSATNGLAVDNKTLPPGAATETTLASRLSESDFDTKAGSLTETAPATDTASSGLNGRLQRIAQRLTSLITALGSPFQAGGSIGNTAFGATQIGTWTVQPGNTANTTAWKTDGSAVTQPVSGTFWQATQPVSVASALGVTDNAGSLTVDAPVGTPAYVRLSDGAAAITTLPVSLASVPSHAVTNAGTFAVQVSSAPSTAVTNAGTFAAQASITPLTTGGLTVYHKIAAASTNATNVKATPGQLFGWYLKNTAAVDRKIAFHNTAGTPTAGASVYFALVIPAGQAANVMSDIGIAFATGIGFTMVQCGSPVADTDATAVAAGDLLMELFYK